MLNSRINNKQIYAFPSKHSFLEFISDKKQILIALNAEKLSNNDAELENLINLNIGYADGIGAVWALRRKGFKATKIAGAEFWLDIISKYSDTKSFYLIGATTGTITNTVEKLKAEFPDINIRGFRNGYLEKGDNLLIINDLVKTKPDFVFVAMGSPRQEFLMQEFLCKHKACYMGLGGSFDVYSGLKQRAPKMFIKLGLEWLYRLLCEPKRIFRQLSLVKFFFKITFDKY